MHCCGLYSRPSACSGGCLRFWLIDFVFFMRLRLLLRRMTVSAPRMAVRSDMPWPIRWAVWAIVFGFCAAMALWAFEFGKDIAGLDAVTKTDVARLRNELSAVQSELSSVKEDRDKAQFVANTAGTLMTTERASLERLMEQVKQLETDNRALRDDLSFFEKLIPVAGAEGLSIRGLQVDLKGGNTIKWQTLVMQAGKNVSEFDGRLELTFSGFSNGKPWVSALPDGPLAIKIRQYGRLEGEFDLPPQTVLKGVTAKVMQGSAVKAAQSIKL